MGKQLDELAVNIAQLIQLQQALHTKFDDLAEKFSMQEVAFDHSTQFLEERLSTMESTIGDILHKLTVPSVPHPLIASAEATSQTTEQKEVAGVVNPTDGAQVETIGFALKGDTACESPTHLDMDLAHDPNISDSISVAPSTMSAGPVPERHLDDVSHGIALDGDIAGGSLLKLAVADCVSVASGLLERGDSLVGDEESPEKAVSLYSLISSDDDTARGLLGDLDASEEEGQEPAPVQIAGASLFAPAAGSSFTPPSAGPVLTEVAAEARSSLAELVPSEHREAMQALLARLHVFRPGALRAEVAACTDFGAFIRNLEPLVASIEALPDASDLTEWTASWQDPARRRLLQAQALS